MISPHPPKLRMKRRKTVSVTPAMGARTVAGEIVAGPICNVAGTGLKQSSSPEGTTAPLPAELSQNLRMTQQKTFTTEGPGNTGIPVPFYATVQRKAPALGRGLLDPCRPAKSVAYFFAVSALAYLRRKRSTRPAVSTSFCLPVKKGWQAEQISTPMSPLWVERVVNVLPHAQCTRTS